MTSNINVTGLVHQENGKLVTTSRRVAEVFGKEHHNVIKAIKNLLEKDVVGFNAISIKDHYGRSQPAYLMDKDAFSLLAMGFTGDRALEWKQTYIRTFNKMAEQLTQPVSPTAQLRLQVEALEAIEKRQAYTDSRVEAIEHKIKTNGCEPGFIPMDKAHRAYGQALSVAMFKAVLEKAQVPSKQYAYTIPNSDGEIAWGTSVLEEFVCEVIPAFVRDCVRVTQYRWTHEQFGDKKFAVNTKAVV